MRRLDMLALATSVLLGACATANITVTPAGRPLDLASRKVDCTVEFYRTRPPERPFDEVATLHLAGARLDAWETQERMRRQACELGADAVVVTRDYLRVGDQVTMTGSAVSYPEMRGDSAARRARDARGLVDLMPPPGFAIAVARSTAQLRTGASPDSSLRGEIAAGTAMWAAQNGDLCRVRHPDGREGWVDCGALEFAPKRGTGEKPAGDEKQPADAPSKISI